MRLVAPVLVVMAGLAFVVAGTSAGAAASARAAASQEAAVGWAFVVRQTMANTCGPALLATLLLRAGVPASEQALAARAYLTAEGMTLAEFARLAELVGFPGVWLRAGGRAGLPRAPFVAHFGGAGHFVLVEFTAHDLVLIADPARGRVALAPAAFRALWSQRAFVARVPDAP